MQPFDQQFLRSTPSSRGPLRGRASRSGLVHDTLNRAVNAATSRGLVIAPARMSSQDQIVAITADELLAIVPSLAGRAAILVVHLNAGLQEAKISNRLGTAMFVAQTAHESDEFTTLEERGGTIVFSKQNFPKATKPDDQRHEYFFIMYDKDSPAENRQTVAADLGNTESGDGKKFRGRGYIQLTGRTNYEAAGKALGLDLVNHPELAAQAANAARIAGWFWKKNRLNRFTHNDTPGNFTALTKVINGGTRGLEQRTRLFVRAKRALGLKRWDLFDDRLSSSTLWA